MVTIIKLKTTLGELFEGAMEANLEHIDIAGVTFSKREIAAILDMAYIDTYDGGVVGHIMEKQVRNLKLGDIPYLKVVVGGKSVQDETISKMFAYV